MKGSAIGELTVGYLDALEDPLHGFTGGYLIVNAKGRPLEFHCTAPVAATKAQEILFGPTLRPYLLGDQIATTLVKKATIKPRLLILGDHHMASCQTAAPSTPLAVSSATQPSSDWNPVEVPDESLWSHSKAPRGLLEPLRELSGAVDLTEPLERIREAIREAQRLGQGEPGSVNQEDANRHAA